METSGCVKVRTEEYNGRLRKYYGITTTGKERIKEFKDTLLKYWYYIYIF